MACSGGADSVALVHLLANAGAPITAVAHVDHGLRDGSADEADLVAAHARSLGLPFLGLTVSVACRGSLEDSARQARWAALRDTAAREGAKVIATGHTVDDQAETVLMRLARGAGASGLAGMRALDGDVWRPVLDLRRAELRRMCETEGWNFVDDPSNDDRVHERNRVRHDILPRLGPRAVPAMARAARLLADDDDLLEELAAAAPIEMGHRSVAIPLDWLAAAHPALARRAVRRACRLAGARYPPSAARVDEARRGWAVSLGGGLRTRRVGGALVVERG